MNALEDFARRGGAVGLGKIGAVAPVLPGAEEERLDAGKAALLVERENVGLLHGARIDALVRLDRRERGKAVAIDRGALEVERGRGLLHLAGQLVLDRLAPAGQERVGFAHQHCVILKIDLGSARRRAALDLVQQARPGPALEKRIAAGAQQERALQRVDGAVDRPDRCKRSEIVARPRARAAMLEDLRRPVVGGDQDVRKRLVVTQEHIEARPQTLDQIGLEQERFRLGAGDDEFERARRGDHALDAGVEAGRPRIGANAVLEVFRFADIEHVAAGIGHAVDAGLGRGERGVTENGGAAGAERVVPATAEIRAVGLRRLREAIAPRPPRRSRSLALGLFSARSCCAKVKV